MGRDAAALGVARAMSHRRSVVVLVAVAVAVVLAATGAGPARAAGVRGQVDSTTTTPPPPVTEPTTTTTPPPVEQPSDSTTVVPAPPTDGATTPAPDPSAVPPVGDGGAETGDPPVFDLPLDTRPRTGDSSTDALLEALRPRTALGFSEQEVFVLGMGQFPVAGLATWSDDFRDPRYNPTPHYHQGNDIWADHGTPVRAPSRGQVELTGEVVGGISVYVTGDDGTYYYMTHLAGFAPGLHTGDTVEQGEVVGFTGATGNAAGGPAHVHFEIHPGGGAAVNPKPILDQWVADALAAATATVVVDDLAANPRILMATGELRRYDVPMMATAERAAKSPLLWSASVSSGGAALRLAEVEAARMAQQVDWGGRASLAQATAVDRHRAQARAVQLLSRLTPPGLRSVLDGSTS